MSPLRKPLSADTQFQASLAYQIFRLSGDPYQQIKTLINSGKTGSLTIHFWHGRPNALEWREPAPKLDFKTMGQDGIA